jgi:hypothetical protein
LEKERGEKGDVHNILRRKEQHIEHLDSKVGVEKDHIVLYISSSDIICRDYVEALWKISHRELSKIT